VVKQKLNPKVLLRLKNKFPKKTQNALQVRLSKLSRKHKVTLNAAAEILGKEEGFSMWGLLDDKDRESLRDKSFQVIKIKKHSGHKERKKIIDFISYENNNNLLKVHLEEINRCYTNSCYTTSFVLIRKVLEYLIVEMIKHKFPGKSKENREICLDPKNRWRLRGFSEIIENFRKKAKQFEREEERLISRILELSSKFKDDADNKAHSLYHVGGKRELEDKNPQQILDLIKEFFNKY